MREFSLEPPGEVREVRDRLHERARTVIRPAVAGREQPAGPVIQILGGDDRTREIRRPVIDRALTGSAVR